MGSTSDVHNEEVYVATSTVLPDMASIRGVATVFPPTTEVTTSNSVLTSSAIVSGFVGCYTSTFVVLGTERCRPGVWLSFVTVARNDYGGWGTPVLRERMILVSAVPAVHVVGTKAPRTIGTLS